MVDEKPGILEDVKFPILGLYKENVGTVTKENERGVNVLHNMELLVLNLDLGNIAGEEVYCH